MTRRHFAAVLVALPIAFLLAAPASAEQARPPVSVQVQVLTHDASGTSYVITARNNLETPQQVVIAQSFARDIATATASDKATVRPESVTWTVQLPPMQPRAVNSQVTFDGPPATRSTACITDPANGRTLDCTVGDLAAGRAETAPGLPGGALLAIVALIVLLGVAVYLLIRLCERWWPGFASNISDHRSSVAVLAATITVIVLGIGGFAIVAGRAGSMIEVGENPDRAMGWAGERSWLAIGLPAASKDVEFTLYQWSCQTEPQTETARQCTATVGVRNTSSIGRQWFRRMQRLHYGPETWIEPDQDATLAANASTDPFAGVLATGERRVSVLVFKPANDKRVSRLELREGAFARGVALQLD